MSCLLPIENDLRADRPGIHGNNISGAAELSKIGLEPSQLAMDDSIHVWNCILNGVVIPGQIPVRVR
jgi:hypothetical protein